MHSPGRRSLHQHRTSPEVDAGSAITKRFSAKTKEHVRPMPNMLLGFLTGRGYVPSPILIV
jgi:hypothetical protein